MFVIFSETLMLDQMFISPQVKRNIIISNKYGIYKFPRNNPNNSRLRILGNKQIREKSQNIIKL